MLFATCPESRRVIFEGVCAYADGDMDFLNKFDSLDWSGSLTEHFQYMFTPLVVHPLSPAAARVNGGVAPRDVRGSLQRPKAPPC